MTARETPEQPAQSADWQRIRRELRATRLAARESLPAVVLAGLSAALHDHLTAALEDLPPATIGFCAPVRNEFDARPLVTRLLAAGWQAVMPVVEETRAPMVFHTWTPGSPMGTDRHGIPIPATPRAPKPPALLLLPLVAFDGEGYRLGYGGGYFDRTLAACVPRPFAIGTGFELGRVASVLPQPHDRRCDAIVTEAGWQGAVPSGITMS